MHISVLGNFLHPLWVQNFQRCEEKWRPADRLMKEEQNAGLVTRECSREMKNRLTCCLRTNITASRLSSLNSSGWWWWWRRWCYYDDANDDDDEDRTRSWQQHLESTLLNNFVKLKNLAAEQGPRTKDTDIKYSNSRVSFGTNSTARSIPSSSCPTK